MYVFCVIFITVTADNVVERYKGNTFILPSIELSMAVTRHRSYKKKAC
jgi:hypothetical protein